MARTPDPEDSEGPGEWILESSHCHTGWVRATEPQKGPGDVAKHRDAATPHKPYAENSATRSWAIGTITQLYQPASSSHSCFPHRLKVGCSWLAFVLMIHHSLSLGRKNAAWSLLGCNFQSCLLTHWPGAWGGEQDSSDRAHLARTTAARPSPRHLLGALKALPL